MEIGTRNIKVALRHLRRFAREGAAEELDLPDTILSTAANAGWLDLKMVPECHNNVKVLMLLDVGGSMDDHIKRMEELFSAAKAEFKHFEFCYFHNCVYDYLWKHNRRRHTERTSTFDVLHKFTPDYKLIFVGDATTSPYELQLGGSVRIQQRRSGCGVAAPFRRSVSASCVAQSRARATMGISPVDFRDPQCPRQSHVCVHHGQPRSGHASFVEVTQSKHESNIPGATRAIGARASASVFR